MNIGRLIVKALLKSSFSYPGYYFWILFLYTLGLQWYCVPFTGDEKVYVSVAMEMW